MAFGCRIGSVGQQTGVAQNAGQGGSELVADQLDHQAQAVAGFDGALVLITQLGLESSALADIDDDHHHSGHAPCRIAQRDQRQAECLLATLAVDLSDRAQVGRCTAQRRFQCVAGARPAQHGKGGQGRPADQGLDRLAQEAAEGGVGGRDAQPAVECEHTHRLVIREGDALQRRRWRLQLQAGLLDQQGGGVGQDGGSPAIFGREGRASTVGQFYGADDHLPRAQR